MEPRTETWTRIADTFDQDVDDQTPGLLEDLLEEADAAGNPATNGILDRSDLQLIIHKLSEAMRRTISSREQMRQQRDVLAKRLSRRPHEIFAESFVSPEQAMGIRLT